MSGQSLTLAALFVVAYVGAWILIHREKKRAVDERGFIEAFQESVRDEREAILAARPWELDPRDPCFMPDWLRRSAKCRAIIKRRIKRASRRPLRRVR